MKERALITVRNSGKGSWHCDLIRRWACCIFLAVATCGAQATNQLAISEDGTPSYRHPIAVPPGIAGMAPNIALLYRGGAVNGPVGHGWTIQGVSMITRCAHNKTIDGSARGVDYSGNDKLCLDGQRLIQTDANGAVINGAVADPGPGNPFQQNDSQGGAGQVREYRTETDIYARIRAYGAAGGNAANGPAYFTVWTKSGQVYEYGVNSNGTANAQITVQGKSAVAAWPVSRISDTVGNYIDFQYAQRDTNWGSTPVDGAATGHEWNLLEIRFTGNGAQLPRNKVVFEYTERPDTPDAAQDRSEAYHNGSKNVSISLLKAVRTYVNWPAGAAATPSNAVKVMTLKLTYDNGAVTRRSRLKQIVECAGAAETQCLPPTVFNYADGGNAAYVHNATFKNSALSTVVMHSTAGDYGVVTGNFFGSGRLDLLRWYDVPAQNELYRNDADGAFTRAAKFNVTDQALFDSKGCYASTVADFNGDGLTDILRVMQATSLNQASCGAPRHILYTSNGDGTFRATDVTAVDFTKTVSRKTRRYNCLIPATTGYWPDCREPGNTYVGTVQTPGSGFFLLDVNNDGLLDIVTTIIPGHGQTMNPPGEEVQCASVVCTRVFLGQTSGNFAETAATNLTHRSVYADPIQATSLPSVFQRAFIADVNGDGVADLAVDTGVWLSRGDGNFDRSTPMDATVACQNPLDINGDGRADCLYPNAIADLRIADGGGTLKRLANFKITPPGQALFGFAPGTIRQSIGVQLGDIDGDGRADILRWNDDPSENAVFLSNGDGSFRRSDTFQLTTPADHLQHSSGTASFLLGDFSGHGNVEILRLKASPTTDSDATRNQLYVKLDSTPPDQLSSVTSGNGLTTTLTWVPLTNPASGSVGPRYISDRGTSEAAAYPAVDLTMPSYVVATSTVDSGVGNARLATEYRYSGLKASFDGRGWLGFREIRRQNPGPNGEPLWVITAYLQDGLYTRMARSTDTWLGGQLLSRRTYLYCDKTAAAGADAGASSAAPCPSTAKVRRPYLLRSIEEGWDPQGSKLPTVVTTNSFNDGGDPTSIVVGTTGTALGLAQTFVKTTTNQYHPDNLSGDAWIRGRLQKATVQNNVPNSLGSIATSAGTAPYATATEGMTFGVVINPSSLTVNAAGPGTASGVVTASATGDSAPYSYSWTRTAGSRTSISSSTAANPTISAALNAGDDFADSWKVTVTDAGGRTAAASVDTRFTAPGAPSLALTDCASVTPTTSPAQASTSCTLRNNGQSALDSISYAIFSGATASGPNGACAAGAVCGTVTAATGTAPGTYSGTLTATPNTGSAASVGIQLEVQPAPLPTTTLSADPANVDFGTFARGGGGGRAVLITNRGSASATGMSYQLVPNGVNNGGRMYLGGNQCPTTLEAGASCTVGLGFNADCIGGTSMWALVVSGANFESVRVPAIARTSQSGVCR
jgi:hypothetical protein